MAVRRHAWPPHRRVSASAAYGVGHSGRRDDRIQVPLPGNTLESRNAAIGEVDARAGHEIPIVAVTRISPGSAPPPPRRRLDGDPPTFRPLGSTSPTCRPARISSRAAACVDDGDRAQDRCAGRSNIRRRSRPRRVDSLPRYTFSCAQPGGGGAPPGPAAPVASSRALVDPTMSVNITVARTRSWIGVRRMLRSVAHWLAGNHTHTGYELPTCLALGAVTDVTRRGTVSAEVIECLACLGHPSRVPMLLGSQRRTRDASRCGGARRALPTPGRDPEARTIRSKGAHPPRDLATAARTVPRARPPRPPRRQSDCRLERRGIGGPSSSSDAIAAGSGPHRPARGRRSGVGCSNRNQHQGCRRRRTGTVDARRRAAAHRRRCPGRPRVRQRSERRQHCLLVADVDRGIGVAARARPRRRIGRDTGELAAQDGDLTNDVWHPDPSIPSRARSASSQRLYDQGTRVPARIHWSNTPGAPMVRCARQRSSSSSSPPGSRTGRCGIPRRDVHVGTAGVIGRPDQRQLEAAPEYS